jgi:MFS family permease
LSLTVARREGATGLALRALAANGSLRRILAAFLLFVAVELGTWVAMLLYAYDRLGAGAVGVVALLQLLPAGLAAPFAATFADRHDRARVLFAAYGLQAVALALTAIGMLAGLPAPVVVVAGAVAVTMMTATRPAQGALLPSIGRTPAELAAANGVAGGVEGIGLLVGPLVAAAILLVGGPPQVFLAGSMAALVAALLVVRVRVPRHGGPVVSGPDHAPEDASTGHGKLLEGLRLVAANRDTRLIVGLLSLRKLVSGALDVLFVLLALEVLGTGDSGAGILGAALGLGTLLGGTAALGLVGRPRLAPALVAAAAILGVGIMSVGVPVPAILVPVLIGVAGVGYAGMDIAGRTILQRVTPNHVLGGVLGGLEGSGLVAVAIGSLLVGPIVVATSVQVAVVATGLVLLAGVALSWKGLRRIDASVRVPVREIAVLRAVDAFALLPPPQLEGVAARTRWLTAAPGEAIVREGDEGDRYYVIESGSVRVTQRGAELRVMGAGDGFGEIALMQNVARTATVTAIEPCVLLALGQHDFLAVVTGHEQLREAVEQTIAERSAAGS